MTTINTVGLIFLVGCLVFLILFVNFILSTPVSFAVVFPGRIKLNIIFPWPGAEQT